jgi:hypothetical protein
VQVENRVGDQLPGAVKGNITTAVTFEKFDAFARELLGRDQHVLLPGIAAESDHWGVFKE